MDHVIFILFLLCYRGRLFIEAALWSTAGKGLTSWLPFVMSICHCHFPLVSWVRSRGRMYQLLIFALFLTLMKYGRANARCNIQFAYNQNEYRFIRY